MSIKTKLIQLKLTLLETEEEVLQVQKQLDAEYGTALMELNSTSASLYATYFTQVTVVFDLCVL